MKSSKIFLILSILFSLGNADRLTISDAYNLALENSKNIKSSIYQLEADRERIEQSKSKLYPQLYLSGNYGKKQYGSNSLGKSSGYTLSLQQSLYNPTTVRGIDVERSKIKLSDLDLQYQKENLAQIVLKIYLDILKSENKIELYQRYAQTNRGKLNLLQRKFDMALSNKMDLLQGAVDYHSSNIDLAKEKRTLRVNKLRLKHLIGRDDFTLPKIDFTQIDTRLINEMKDRVDIDSNRLSNIKIEEAKEAITLSNKEIELAYSAYLPSISLSAQYTEIYADRRVSSFENTKSIMVQLQIPIYKGGIIESQVHSAKLSRRVKEEEFLQVQDETKEQYNELLAEFNSAIDSLPLYQEALNAARLYLEAIEQGLNHGLKSSLDLNDANNKLYEVKYRYIENINGIINSYIGLLIVTNSLDGLEIVDRLIL